METVVISMETNPVVAAHCRKMDVPYIQGENDKAGTLAKVLEEHGIYSTESIFIGNDINDLPCFPFVEWSAAVADALPEVMHRAYHVSVGRAVMARFVSSAI